MNSNINQPVSKSLINRYLTPSQLLKKQKREREQDIIKIQSILRGKKAIKRVKRIKKRKLKRKKDIISKNILLREPIANIEYKETIFSRKFQADSKRYNININRPIDYEEVNEVLFNIMKRNAIKNNIGSNDLMRFIILDNEGNALGSTPYVKRKRMNNTIPQLTIGNSTVDSKGSNWEEIGSHIAEIHLQTIKAPEGGSRSNPHSLGAITNKTSVIKINNTDNLCLGRCLVVALAIRDNHPKLQQIKMGRKIQTTLTHELYNKAGIPQEIGDISVIEEFEKYLDCCICIIDQQNFLNFSYEGDMEKEFKIYLYKNGNHFDLVNSNKLQGFFGKDYFCKKCNKTYTHKNQHRCSFKCNICCSYDCDCIGIDFKKHTNWTGCQDCNRNFPSTKCFNTHKETEACDKYWKCLDCKKKFDSKRFDRNTHTCGDYWCNNCKAVVDKNHKCYMTPKPIKEISNKYIFFDFEATQNKGTHEVNLCVSQYFDDPTPIIHYSIEEFCEWLFDKKHKGYTILAHNGKGYDYQFIMKYIYKKTSYKPFIVYAGSKIMTFSIKQGLNIRFVDSVNFMTCRLEDFPKTFGIKELKKGFYPHLFNTADNYNYIGDIPPRKDFCCNSFGEKKRKEFLEWYDNKQKNNYIWNNKQELLDYCISDVDILRRSMIVFRQLYIDIADIDPLQYTTIASVCMAIFRGHYIVDNFNTEYISAVEEDRKEEFLEQTRLRVIEEGKIAVVGQEDQEYIRKSFFGGRTNASCLKYEFKGDEIGRYRDITSLYPTVNYYDEYGLGHLKTITENFGDIKQYKGFIDCEIVPPKDLYFPVLPTKGEKLVFDLNKKRGIWTTQEVNKAVEKGYIIKKIHSIKYYERTSRTLFRGYVEKFLKIKQQASGYPEWCKTENEKDKYIKDYYKVQNIKLDKDKIKVNKGLRAVAKLCLNSLWGKFGMRNNLPKTEVLNCKKRFNQIMFSNKYKDHNLFFIDDERVEMTYKDVEIDTTTAGSLANTTNIGIASFTTSWARLRLYEGLETLGEQALYNDTDSIIYKYDKNNPNHKEIELGDGLGDWTDELEGCVMVGTFISGGPKNYSYETDDGIFHTKVKGFNLNYSVSKIINHNSMIEVVDNRELERTENFKEIDYFSIVRNKDKSLKSVIQPKRYMFGYDKRYILEPDENGNIFTLPFNHKDIKIKN